MRRRTCGSRPALAVVGGVGDREKEGGRRVNASESDVLRERAASAGSAKKGRGAANDMDSQKVAVTRRDTKDFSTL
jgi:hypothetical protein